MLASLFLMNSFLAYSEENSSEDETSYATAYISDDLFVYMHAGPGNNYRIVGSINSGDEVKITGSIENGYTQILDPKNRTTWIESKYVSTAPGLRVAIAELNTKLALNEEATNQTDNSLAEANAKIDELNQQNIQLTDQISSLKNQLATTESQLSNQDLDLKKEYFFNGAIVLAIGLILGLVLPRLTVRKKASMESWK